MSLHLSDDLKLHLKYLQHRTVFLGGSGSGKTAAGRLLFEQATAAGVLCGAIDLKADWWGLKSTADGKGPGLPVVVLGGEHQDLPLDPEGGALTADILVELRQPFVLDLEQFSRTKQIRFLGAFLDRLYDRNRDPLVLFLDEADRYAPQKPMSPEANLSLGAAEDLVKRGRKHGLFPVVITQRNASLNKNVSELCEIAWIFRTTGPHDQDAVRDWLSVNATKEQRDAVMGRLSSLPTGTAILCCAHPALKLFQTVALALPATFDSSATPEIGRRRIEPKQLAMPDLVQLRQRMAATIEKAKAEDPKELRKRITELELELNIARRLNDPKSAPKVETTVKEVPVLKDSQVSRLEGAIEQLRRSGERMVSLSTALREDLAKTRVFYTQRKDNPGQAREIPAQSMQSLYKNPAKAHASTPKVQTSAESTDIGTGGLRRMLIALAQRPQGLSTRQLGVRAGLSSRSGTFRNYVSRGRTQGWLLGTSERLTITDAGLTVLGTYAPLPTGDLLLKYWLDELGESGASRILAIIAQAYPERISVETIGERTGLSPQSGTFRNYLSRLRTLELIEGRSELIASEELFD